MEQQAKQCHWCVTTFTVEPVDHLLLHIQWLNARSDALLACLDKKRSPFATCCRQLCSMLGSPIDVAHFKPGFDQFSTPEWTLNDVALLIFKQALRMSAELWLRFLHFTEFLLPVIRLGDISLNEKERLQLASDFWDTPACCRTHPHQ
jgi:hypothetical protein